MKSIKDETDQLYGIIHKFENATLEANRIANEADCGIRDYGKKVHSFEMELETTIDKLNKATEEYEEKDKLHAEVEADIAALARRIMLMEEETTKAEANLANTVTKLALSSKSADDVMRKVKAVENKCSNNEVTLEELERAIERAELAESKLKGIEEELQLVGENMKQLEKSAEKAVMREEKLKEKILSIQQKFKAAEGRYEYGEMNITKL